MKVLIGKKLIRINPSRIKVGRKNIKPGDCLGVSANGNLTHYKDNYHKHAPIIASDYFRTGDICLLIVLPSGLHAFPVTKRSFFSHKPE